MSLIKRWNTKNVYFNLYLVPSAYCTSCTSSMLVYIYETSKGMRLRKKQSNDLQQIAVKLNVD